MTVSEADLEHQLAHLQRRAGDPRAGIYGPGSLSWEVNREAVVMLGGGAAALLQLAHPWVAHAIDQHSETRRDLVGRFQRTFGHVFRMVFGDLEQALGASRRVHAVHAKIRGAIHEDVGHFRRGDRYHANDEAALLWVHTTLVDTARQVYELVVRPLSGIEREAYWRQSKLFAYLFGLDDSSMPESFVALQRWYTSTLASETIAVGEPARALRGFLLAPPTPLHRPAAAWLEIFTAGLLPPKLRAQFGFAWGPFERLAFRQSVSLLRAGHRVAPERLKYFPAYLDARRRLAGQPVPDYLGHWIERAALRGLRRRP